MKYVTIAILVLVLLGGGYYVYTQRSTLFATANPPATEPSPAEPASTTEATTSAPAVQASGQEVLGKSVDDRDIVANHLIEYLGENPDAVPAGVKVTVIPTLNPDGLAKVTSDAVGFSASDITASQATQVEGRFNANDVDLNRNFDCDWKASGIWQNKAVSGGSK